MDWVVFRQSSQDQVTQDGQPLNEDRFVLRRARLRAEQRPRALLRRVRDRREHDQRPQLRPINAEASFKWPADRPYARRPWAYEPSGTTPRTSEGGPADPTAPPRVPPSSEPWFMVTAGLFRDAVSDSRCPSPSASARGSKRLRDVERALSAVVRSRAARRRWLSFRSLRPRGNERRSDRRAHVSRA